MAKLVIFDLDGTLLNTIEDLAASVNYGLEQCGFPVHEVNKYKLYVGNGIRKLFERALPEGEKTSGNIERIREHFLIHYAENNTKYTRPYPGIELLLAELVQRNIQLAVASNKYHAATEKLIRSYFPTIPFAAVYGQREGIATKPDPTIVYDILKKTDIEAGNTLYVGDSGVDMQTARNSHIEAIGVTWGFRCESELKENGADHIAHTPTDILHWV